MNEEYDNEKINQDNMQDGKMYDYPYTCVICGKPVIPGDQVCWSCQNSDIGEMKRMPKTVEDQSNSESVEKRLTYRKHRLSFKRKKTGFK
jgi:hypothetical protein